MAEYELHLTTYPAYLGGGHTYAQVVGDDRVDVRLTRVLDEAGARALLRHDPDAGYRAGEETERFETRDAALEAARDWLRTHGEPGDRMYFGYGALCRVPLPDPLFELPTEDGGVTNERDSA